MKTYKSLYNKCNFYNIALKSVMYKVNIQNFTRILFLVFLLFRFCGNSFASEHNIPQNIHQDVQEQCGNNVNASINAKVEDIILKKQNNVIEICCDKECLKLERLFGIGMNIINNNFVNDVYAVECNDELLNNFIAKYLRNMQHKILYKEEDKYIENNVHLFVLITVNPGEKRYLVYCDDANSKQVGDIFYGLFHGSKATVIEILSCGNNIKNMSHMFYYCRSLTKIKFPDNFNTDNVTDMSCMFYECSSLKELNLSSFNTSSVTDMDGMFYHCTSLTSLNISNFNTDKVTNMNCMFDRCRKLTSLNLLNFKINNDTKMFFMFLECFDNGATLLCLGGLLQKLVFNERINGFQIQDQLKKNSYGENKKYICRFLNHVLVSIEEVSESNLKSPLMSLPSSSSNSLKTSLGVNIGSLNTVYSKCGKPEGKFKTNVLLSDVSKRVIPSQICYSPTHRLYGATAAPFMKKNYTTSYENLSRLLGFDIKSPIFSDELNNFFNYGTYNKDTNKFKIANNEEVSSEVIIADYLSLINKFYFEKEKEKESENEKYDFVTFSVPDYFTAFQKKELKLIAEAIGMKNVNIISESSAITMYYGHSKYRDMFVTNVKHVMTTVTKYVVFVDIGYSKTSFIFAKFTYNIFKVEYVKIYPNLGGRDFDNAIMKYCLEDFKKNNSGIILELTPKLKKRCLEVIQKGRGSLSANKDVTFTVESFYNNVNLSCYVTKEKFEEIVQQQLNDFEEYLKSFKEYLKNKNYDTGNLIVEMAGELMRTPILQEITEKIFNVNISKGILIDECASIGAALYGDYINGILPINTFKKFDDYNHYPIVCYIQGIHNNNDNGCIQLNSEFIKKNNEIIIKCDQKYDKNTINLYTYKVNLSKLRQIYPDCANKNCSIYPHISDVSKNNSFNLTYFSENNRPVSENIDNCIELKENTFNSVDVKRKGEISKIIIRHKKLDAIYYAYVKAKNEISKIINAINNSNDKHKQKMDEFSQQIKNDLEDKQKEFNDYTIEGNEKNITELLYIGTNMYQYFLENDL